MRPAPAKTTTSAATRWTSPVPGAAVGTPFGATGPLWSSGRHTGTDFPSPTGTDAVAVAGGRVTYAGDTGGWAGIQVRITHRPGLESWYCHLSAAAVTRGANVAAGQRVGAVGATGNTTGPHLHLEAHRDGVAIDPMPFIDGTKNPGPATSTGGTAAATPAGVLTGAPGAVVEDVAHDLMLMSLAVAFGVGLIAIGAARFAKPAVDAAVDSAADTASKAAMLLPQGRAVGAATKGAGAAGAATKGATR